jgi:AcrR family transcriptional regulator
MADPDARTRLREAALELFGRQGMNTTSTRAILSAAGLRNPSAINYHFGSKAGLVEDLVAELTAAFPVLELQIGLARGPRVPTVEEWAAIAVDSAIELISTERGRLLARLWWEYDATVHPNALEAFLASGDPTAVAWQEAAATVVPTLPPLLAVTRNVVMLRTLEWMIARRAGRMLTPSAGRLMRTEGPGVARQLMLEVAVAIVSAPTELGDGDITVS